MKFNLDLITDIPKLKRVNVNGKRFYVVEGEEHPIPFPSVTSVLSADKQKQKSLHEWRRRVGAAEANKVARQASSRGTAAHQLIEDYVQGKENEDTNPLHLDLFSRLRKVADERINNIRMIEGQMYSKHLRVAGTVDMVAEFDGKLSVIDWKTSRREKKRDQITSYFIQESAYAVMFEELTGIPVPYLVTVITTEEGETQIFREKRDDWIGGFIALKEEFDRQNPLDWRHLAE